jgi:outer membrane protein assembly factor BamE (lipoprotein component of BamABCDE complex)
MRIFFFPLILLTGCFTSGTRLSTSQLAQLREGMSPAEVLAICGSPQSDIAMWDGNRHWTYSSVEVAAVLFVSNMTSTTVSLIFRKGRLAEWPGYAVASQPSTR